MLQSLVKIQQLAICGQIRLNTNVSAQSIRNLIGSNSITFILFKQAGPLAYYCKWARFYVTQISISYRSAHNSANGSIPYWQCNKTFVKSNNRASLFRIILFRIQIYLSVGLHDFLFMKSKRTECVVLR